MMLIGLFCIKLIFVLLRVLLKRWICWWNVWLWLCKIMVIFWLFWFCWLCLWCKLKVRWNLVILLLLRLLEVVWSGVLWLFVGNIFIWYVWLLFKFLFLSYCFWFGKNFLCNVIESDNGGWRWVRIYWYGWIWVKWFFVKLVCFEMI